MRPRAPVRENLKPFHPAGHPLMTPREREFALLAETRVGPPRGVRGVCAIMK